MDPTLAHKPPLPRLGLPLRRRGLGPGAALALFAHAAIVGMLLVGGRALVRRTPGDSTGDARGGGGGPRVNFFTMPPAAPAVVDVAAAPRVAVSDLLALRRIPVELPPLELPRAVPPLPAVAVGGEGGGGVGAVAGGKGTGLGAGAGGALGPGTGGEAGYIFPASPRTAILPPLARVPGSVAGRTYHVRFWVSAEGRVTQVAVDPPIADAAYGREFQERMLAYQFYPAHTRDGRNVAYVAMVPLRIGN